MTVIDEKEPSPETNPPNESIDEQRRRFLLATTGVLGGVGVACALTPLLSSWLPSAKAEAAGAPVRVDLSKIEPGQQVTVEWRGKPVWIIRRTKEMLEKLREQEQLLRDPGSIVEQQPAYAKNHYRSINPAYLVLTGICTHLGCSPKYTPHEKELGPLAGWFLLSPWLYLDLAVAYRGACSNQFRIPPTDLHETSI